MKTIIILGPTASGKTKLSMELAKQIDGEIISADSMQVYRGMDIGTAKPTLDERQGIPHHLIDIRNPDEEWTVSDFVEQTNKLVPGIISRGKQPIIVGGTGLYLWALLNGYSFPPQPESKEVRERLGQLPLSTLYSQLSTLDPAAAAKINPNDKKRIVRALEVCELTGRKISGIQESGKQKAEHGTQEYTLIGLSIPRDTLYSRINQRVEEMLAKGLIDEVKELLAKGYSKDLAAFQALGYKDVIDRLNPSTLDLGPCTLDKLAETIKQHTRNFAKRQMTWFRRFKEVKWFEPQVDLGAILDYIK